MRFSLNVILITLLFMSGSAYLAQGKGDIRIQCQIFRIFEDVSGKSSIDEKVWTTDEPPEKFRNIVTLFDEGDFLVGGHNLKLNSSGLFWDKKKIHLNDKMENSLPNDLMAEIASPDISMKNETQMTMKINSKKPIQYFESRDRNIYELKEVSLPTGVNVDVWASLEGDNRILLTDLVLSLNYVARRENLKGTNLQVGYPILEKESYTFYFRVKSGKDYGILIRPKHGKGVLLIRLRTSKL